MVGAHCVRGTLCYTGMLCYHLLEPVLDLIEHLHGDGVNRGYFLGVVFKEEHHIKILEMETDTLEVNTLYLVQRYHKWRLK